MVPLVLSAMTPSPGTGICRCAHMIKPCGDHGLGPELAPSPILCAPCHPKQDGTCRFQPKKAIAFVKDVANITIVSTAPSLRSPKASTCH